MAALDTRVLILGVRWWQTDDTLSLIQQQLVRFLRKWEVQVRLVYPDEKTQLVKSAEEEMRECGVDALLCADRRICSMPPPSRQDDLLPNLHLYYDYMLHDAATFGDITHVIAFAPDMATEAIQLKADFQKHYMQSVEVILVNYRQLDNRTEEGARATRLMYEQQWFSRCNTSQVWSLGHTIFDYYSTQCMHGDDPSPHRLLLFRPTFPEVNVDLDRLKENLILTVLPFNKRTTSENDCMKDVGSAVADLHAQMHNQPRLQWIIATTASNLVSDVMPNTCGKQTIKQLPPEGIRSQKALLWDLQKYRMYVSPSEDDTTFNMLDWVLIGSGMPVLVTAASCVGHTLGVLRSQSMLDVQSLLPRSAVVKRASYGTITDTWSKSISDILINRDSAVRISRKLGRFVQENTFIHQTEQEIINTLDHHATQGHEPAYRKPFSSESMPIYPLAILDEMEVAETTSPFSENLTERERNEVAKRIGADWMKVATKLGITYDEQQSLFVPSAGGPEGYAFKVLIAWRQTVDMASNDMKKTLMEALVEMKRNDVVEIVNRKWPAQMDEDDSSVLENVFQDITANLTRDWDDLRIYLGLPSTVSETIRAPPMPREPPQKPMLQLWSQRTPHNQKAILVKVLKDIGRNDIVKFLVAYRPATAPAQLPSGRNVSNPPPQTTTTQRQTEDPEHHIHHPPQAVVAETRLPSNPQRFTFGEDLSDHGPRPSSHHPRITRSQTMDSGQPSQGVANQLPSQYLANPDLTSLPSSSTPSLMPSDYQLNSDAIHKLRNYNTDINNKVGEGLLQLITEVGNPHLSRPVYVALLDTGINTNHPDLKRNRVVVANQNLCLPDDNGREAADLQIDAWNHGTLSAGILWQYTGSTVMKIINLKVLRENGQGDLHSVERALNYIKKWDNDHPDTPVDIILITLGVQRAKPEVDRLLSELGEHKILICCAGNTGHIRDNTVLNPAVHHNVIAVGCCDEFGNRLPCSAVGHDLHFLFPGNVWSTSSKLGTGNYSELKGTSAAAPYCAAVVVLVLAYVETIGTTSGAAWRKFLTRSTTMRDFLQNSASSRRDNERGFGIVDLRKLQSTAEAYLKEHYQET